MINGDVKKFLDLGWLNESEIFYKGKIYWCEGYFDEKTGINHFFIRKWLAKTEDWKYYITLVDSEGNPAGYDDSFRLEASDIDTLREMFLKSPVFEGKTFWEVEKELAWLDDSGKKETISK